VIDAAVTFYERAFERSREAPGYLQSRGISLDQARALRVGYAAPGLARHLADRGLNCDAARRVGLLAGSRDALQHRIVIPDLDSRGCADWLTGRALNDREPRYLNLRLPAPLLGLRRVQGPAVIVTEGLFDWLTAAAWGLPSVALLGTRCNGGTVGQLARFHRVYIALDADGPGRRASARLASALGARAIVVRLPQGAHDLNELGCGRDGRGAFLRSLNKARARREESWQDRAVHDQDARAA